METQKPVGAEVLSAPVTPQSQSNLDAMLKVMLAREARLAAAEEALEVARAHREAQRDRNAKSSFEDERVTQAKCRHLKGGKHRSRVQATDYAVYHFTFINMERVIRCFLCKMKWKTQDTRELLVRGGKKIANHTKLGWEDAVRMLEQSSNTPSSSEIAMKVTPVADAPEIS